MQVTHAVARLVKGCGLAFLAALNGLPAASAAPMNLPDTPLFIEGGKTALVQLVVERDNKLFFEAYPTYEDINGDGVLDIRYKPDEIDYYGYFESTFCYTHTGAHFQATSMANNKRCLADPTSWSGDLLNYVTMTRMDVMLRALYGGKRLIDTPTQTVLRRAFVPWDNHTWGIEYTSEAVDGFRISDYSPLAQPANGRRHHLATNNFVGLGDVPYLRIRLNSTGRIWNWVDKERTQGDGRSDQNIILDVEACRTGFLDSVCQEYPDGNFKPIGLLHEYGENNSMYFSLITGSFENNTRGGVLRQTMSSFGEEEVDNDTGVFSSTEGIVRTLDAIQIPNDHRSSTVQRDCGWLKWGPFTNGQCRAWGNPVAEMMYEGMRYLAGAQTPTPSFFTDTGMDATLGLSAPEWDDPYSADQPYSQCSAAYQLVISDPSPSFDGDDLPGSHFSSFSDSSLGSLHAGDLADFISSNESAIPGMKFIGESNGEADGSPQPKMVTSFRTIRGQAPEAPNRQGSYYSPSVAYHGHQNDVQPNVIGKQSVGNFTLALGSPLPTIDVPVDGQTIKFAPFAKTVSGTGGCSYRDDPITNFRPTNAIVGFVVEELTPTSGSFRVSFEDMEQGADNDMDAIGRYTYNVVGNDVEFSIDSIAASGCFIQHMGYTVSGSTADGVYLVVRDRDTRENTDPDFPLDVPPGASPGTGWDDGIALPLTSNLRFTPTATPAAQLLEPPLWYAAKWGGFNDMNDDGIPQSTEWDSNADGDPDNYFKVTDPSKMVDTLRSVFSAISEASADATAVGVAGGSLNEGSRIYESRFLAGQWSGDLTSRAIDKDGNIASDVDWNVNTPLSKQIDTDSRTILTYKPSSGEGIAFRWPADASAPGDAELDPAQIQHLSRDPITGTTDALGERRLDYLRGQSDADFRSRDKPLGDIVHSSPQLVGPPVYFYPDNWGAGEPETNEPYSAFGRAMADRDRVVYVGANDGMLHAFDAGRYTEGEWTAGTGREIFAYVPSPVYEELPELGSVDYGHKYYVDASPRIGDALIGGQWRTVLVGGLGRGGQGVYALDVTEVDSVSEDNAGATVLWEFTDEDDADLGYTYTSPLIARMHNGRWAAIFGNGFNAVEPDGNQSSTGIGAIFIVDLETGELIKKMSAWFGTAASPNGINAPTAVDIDNDNIVDYIYTGDLRGSVTKYDVRDSSPSRWERIGDNFFSSLRFRGDRTNETHYVPITTELAVGSHPTGEGIMLYFGTGKYLEPSDHEGSRVGHRLHGVWDRDPASFKGYRNQFRGGVFLNQTLRAAKQVPYDADKDGVTETTILTRQSSQNAIDWRRHSGWYMNLTPQIQGEQVISRMLLREGKLIFSTHIPTGNVCEPSQEGWLMVLDAASGAMPGPSFDLNGDARFTTNERVTGVQGIGNPLSAPSVVAAGNKDALLTSSADGSGANSTSLNSTSVNGRLSWRELQP